MHLQTLLQLNTELLAQVLRFEHPADACVSRFFRQQRQLGQRERGTLAETTYTVLRNKLRYEWFARSAPRQSGPAALTQAKNLVSLGFAESFPKSMDYLLQCLQPAEQNWLREALQIKPEDCLAPHRHNLPEWLAGSLQRQMDSENFWALANALQNNAPLDLRVNTAKTKRAAVLDELQKLGISASATPYSPWGVRLADKSAMHKLRLFESGEVEVQDEGSQLLALLCEAGRGQMVADFCAGAGGKTLALGMTMRNTGRLYAFDTAAHRLDAIKPRLARSGLSNIHPVAIAHERDERIKRLAGKMDVVLVDAPCTGLGTLRRNPDLKWRQNPQSVVELSAKQSAILASAARLLKPNGRLVYATCSLLREENEAIAEQFNASFGAHLKHSEMDSAKNPSALRFNPVPVASVLQGNKIENAQGLCSGENSEYLRLWPHSHQTDGFFAAVWQRLG